MLSSSNEQDLDQDQRNNGSMEDSTMTIEFLRARLLSERSVCKTARQRADELTKRVAELEEQLKIVSLQRKKAEKAAADVLAILENHGASDLSEEFDSSSDQEINQRESKSGDVSPEEGPVSSKIRTNHTDEFSGSELECSLLPGRSLSWKSGKHSPHSRERKYVDSSIRRRGSFASTTSTSPRHHVGKSCRQIRRRETRLAVKESQRDNGMIARESEDVTCSEGASTHSDSGREILTESSEKRDVEVFLKEPVSRDLENQRRVANTPNYDNTQESYKDMEKALKHQAQLIGRYEEEEKAQRDWEEKFRENDNGTPDSCEPGNQSDITEERDETKAHAPPCPIWTIASQENKVNARKGDVSIAEKPLKSEYHGFQSPPHVDQKSSTMPSHGSSASEVFPVATQKQDHQNSRNNALVPYEAPQKLGTVLEALTQAKLSLKHKLKPMPALGSTSDRKAIGFSVGDRPEVPVGCAGLFRVPSDFQLEPNILSSNSRLSLTHYYSDAVSALSVVDRSTTNPYTESRFSYSAGDRHPTVPTRTAMESRSRIPSREQPEVFSRFSSHKPSFEPSLDAGVPFSNRYAYNGPNMNRGVASSNTYSYPTYPLYPDIMARMPSDEGHGLFPSNGAGMPPANHFSFYDDHIRPSIYR